MNPLHDFSDTDLMSPSEVAALFRVDPKTVTRWAKAGKLTFVRTMGGHRRFPRAEINALFSSTVSLRQCPPPGA